MQIAMFEPEGDVLAFLPGQEDIEDAMQSLQEKIEFLHIRAVVCPLYSNMPAHE